MTDEERNEYNTLLDKGLKGANLSEKDEEKMNKLGKLSVEEKKLKK